MKELTDVRLRDKLKAVKATGEYAVLMTEPKRLTAKEFRWLTGKAGVFISTGISTSHRSPGKVAIHRNWTTWTTSWC